MVVGEQRKFFIGHLKITGSFRKLQHAVRSGQGNFLNRLSNLLLQFATMKKYLNIAFAYAIAAMAGGVFYREFTEFNGFTGVTALGKVHTHLFLLGMLVFLVVALFAGRQDLRQPKTFRAFLWTYNLGVPLTAVMLAVRGVAQVLGWTLSAAADASISGIAGIGHVLTGVGLVLLLVSLRKSAEA